MKRFVIAGVLAAFAVAAAGSASATVFTGFDPGVASPTAGYTVIDNFNTALGLGSSTGNGYILTTADNDQGAPPGNSFPTGTQYLSVLGGGGVTINFSALTSQTVNSFEFDWGSIDTYNTLVIHGSDGDTTIIPGTSSFPNLADGNQVLPGTNGVFTVTGSPGETFSGLTLTSSENSFEVDNLAIAGVPEPATWLLMIMGVGGIGMTLRNRRQGAAALI